MKFEVNSMKLTVETAFLYKQIVTCPILFPSVFLVYYEDVFVMFFFDVFIVNLKKIHMT